MEMTAMSTKSDEREHAAEVKAEAKAEREGKYKHKATMPTLASPVWYYHVNSRDEHGDLSPHAAMVAKVSDHDDTVNLTVLEHSGMPVNAARVPVMTKNAKPEELAALEDYCIIPA
jgi:hypothetical protein